MNDIKTYSRKEIMSWIQSYPFGTEKFEDLRNGVFYCLILKQLFPEDFIKQRIYEKPAGDYESMSNLNLMKKVLNKHGYQLNLNVSLF